MPPGRTCRVCGKPLRKEAAECFFCKTEIPDSSSFDEVSFPAVKGYRILRFVAEGGMGSVYEAEEEALGRRVALKMVSERFLAEEGSLARFQREARVMANVEHPNIVRVYAYGEHEGKPYFAMEFVEGEILSKRIERQGKLPVEEALRVLRQTIEALEAAWEKDIVHRDIKPSNILLDKKGRVRVADFGLAKPMRVESDVTLTGQGYILGTPHYVSPEQARGQAVDFRSDIYSLGIVLYEMLAGERPFEGTTPFAVVEKHLVAPLPPLREKRPDVPESVLRLLEWMTKKSPGDRPSSYEAILEIIQSVLGVTPSTPIPTRTMLRAKKPRKALWLRAAGAAAVVVVLAAVGFSLWRSVGRALDGGDTVPTLQDETRLVVAVTPFYGPDEDSAKEGRVMAALVEREIKERLGKDDVKVLGIEETKEPVREHEAAREMGERLGATVVLWGEAFALRGETEIQPYFTMVPRKRKKEEEKKDAKAQIAALEDPMSAMEEQAAEAMVVGAEAPNQIELRKTSAAGVGDMVLFLAGMHALYTENDAEKALKYFEEAPRTAESLRYQAQALLRIDEKEDALAALQEAVALNPKDAQSYAQLGDLHMEADRWDEAVLAYRRASELSDSYTTQRAVFYDGKLYVRETYESERYAPAGPMDTAYLLALDPETGKVLERHHLPGRPVSFMLKEDSLQIAYESPWFDNPLITFITLADGKLDRPVFYGGDFLFRMQSMRASWSIASNFMDDLKKREYVPNAKFAEGGTFKDSPKTLQELETACRAAIEKDPTQPRYPFFLGQALWSQERKEEATKIWEEMLEGEYPAIPYYDYSWMANDFERLGQREWADRAYEEALKRRKQLPQPIEWTFLPERIINFHVFRAASWASRKGVDLERQHLWLERARELSGVCTEGDDFSAAAWEEHFRERGEMEKAEREAEWFRKAREHPLNYNVVAARGDYALYALMSTLLGFFVFLAVIASRVENALMETPKAEIPVRFAHLRRIISTMSNAMRWSIGTFLVCLFLSLLAWAYFVEEGSPVADATLTIVSLAAGLFLMWLEKVSFVRAIEAVPVSARRGLAVALLSVAASSVWVSAEMFSLGSMEAVPLGVMDSLGDAPIVQDLDNRLEENDFEPVRYAAAVVNHMAGNVERAKELYQGLPKDERVKKNLAALQKGELVPPVPLTAEDLYRAYTVRPWKERFMALNPFYAFKMVEEI